MRVDGETEELNLIGADAPEPGEGDDDLGECYAREASDRIRDLLKEGDTVYLERDEEDRDGKDRLLRYVWVPGADGDKAYLLNTKMVREGYASFKSKDPNTTYDHRLKEAEDYAKEKKRGLWKACGGAHVEITPPPELGEVDNPAPIGTTLNTDGQNITVSEAFFTYEFGFATPKGGYIFIVISARIENVDDDDHGYTESRFSARDMDTGATFDDTFTLADQPLGSGDLSPGEFVFGQVVLEVQETATRVRIKYDPKSLGEGDEAYWIVQR